MPARTATVIAGLFLAVAAASATTKGVSSANDYVTWGSVCAVFAMLLWWAIRQWLAGLNRRFLALETAVKHIVDEHIDEAETRTLIRTEIDLAFARHLEPIRIQLALIAQRTAPRDLRHDDGA